MATKPKTDVAVKEDNNLPMAMMADMAADAGMGLEGADKDSFAIPFIAMLQGLSPQLETVESAKPGLFINTITNEVFKEALVVPCAYQRRYLRWAPRDAGGGYKGDFSPIDVETGKLLNVERGDDGRLRIDGDELKDTRNHFVLVRSTSGVWQPALLSLSSTQIKKSKRWMSLIQGIEMRNPQGKPFTPPSFSHVYKLTGVKEENSKGSWWGINIEVVEPVADQDLYLKAREFSKQVAAGEVKVSEPVSDAVHEEGGDDRF